MTGMYTLAWVLLAQSTIFQKRRKYFFGRVIVSSIIGQGLWSTVFQSGKESHVVLYFDVEKTNCYCQWDTPFQYHSMRAIRIGMLRVD